MSNIADDIAEEAAGLLDRGVYIFEAKYIMRTINAVGCNRFIDLGCSMGVLAKRVFEEIIPISYVGVDANQHCITYAAQLLSDIEVDKNFHCYTIVPDHVNKEVSIKGVVGDLVNTSNIYYAYRNAISFPSQNIKIKDLLDIIKIQPYDFVKIDVESIDTEIVVEMIKQNMLPLAFQFEVQRPQIHDVTLFNILAKLEKLGYLIPDINTLLEASYVTICVSKIVGSVLIATGKNKDDLTGFNMTTQIY